ncbi:MAG: hypothetical protein FIB07_07965 [Candidatus Methanoperedens sp.]|nr:hypothetical protein [Candidatus Methanoperedens sp.]
MSIIAKITGFFKKSTQDSEKNEQLDVHIYIGKYVKQDYIDIGESIAIDGRRIIIKKSGSVMSIPFEAIVKTGDNIRVGDFNMEESLRLGKEWNDQKDVLKFDDKGMMIQ